VALAAGYSDADRARLEGYRRSAFIGTGPQVAERIRDLATRTGANEVAIVTWAYDETARIRSYQLIAEALGVAADNPNDRGPNQELS
jgi:alkanesulfonate monooxygenase SsuD/methylene tetrahydromethanopterin reductase-like flavin-dependent oxidoreductase (luciferase family)